MEPDVIIEADDSDVHIYCPAWIAVLCLFCGILVSLGAIVFIIRMVIEAVQYLF